MPQSEFKTTDYWPDLTKLLSGWRIVKIEWQIGRCYVVLECQSEHRMVRSSGFHRSPVGAFDQALYLAAEVPEG
jgi:hypothetical protein